MFEDVDKTNERVKKAEEVELARINRSLSTELSAIERIINRNWNRIKNQNELLPDEKTSALFDRIQRDRNIGERDFSNALRNAYDRVRAEGTGLNQKWITEQFGEFIVAGDLNNAVDFWVIDGNNRIGDWNRRFLSKVEAGIRLGFQSGLGQDQILNIVRQNFGSLQFEVKRVVTTGSTGVISGVSERLARSNNLDLVL